MSEPELECKDEMREFEQQLQRTLRRVNAPETMAAVLMQAAAEEDLRKQGRWRVGKILAFPKPQPWLTSALAASVIGLCVFGGVHVHHEREQVLADQQFDAATQATDHALQQTRAQLRRAGIPILQ